MVGVNFVIYRIFGKLRSLWGSERGVSLWGGFRWLGVIGSVVCRVRRVV